MGKEVICRVKLLLVVISMYLLVASVPAVAKTDQIFVAADAELVESVETFQFRSRAEQRRAIELSRRLRCPQCQNQNLIESNSPVAKDLRLKVYHMVNAGESDDDVIEYMTSRFGDFVLYKPRLNPQTYLLWGGPFLLLGLFGSIIWVTIRRQKRN
ncbi:cytochrome c-type biogenesis protein [Photobacterium sp. DNB23_23_1]|uniref:Cytochrome c-type biogenesis protein n=1 Tax=Photobacterium pectinilyticum TaxID=2906793 RepID=A0ABT1N9E7_9GAMM|nr:cytochrome c-type biogenesis protein [Photobacterium sp. ZSDE20]MCQ1061172.1 cytochrome c-type biogenesis protein CcmH [Photobacterium sp. ZSDE20]MDD1829389.1 cytochrome c-type biogenesis protein CcmH [Photobacterium sp. ZSDE20]